MGQNETPHLPTSAELVLLAKQGDEAAFDRLALRLMPTLRHQAAVYKSAETEEEDLVQEGLLAILRAVRSYRPEGGASFETYARVCIRNRFISIWRQTSQGVSVRADSAELLDEQLPSMDLPLEEHQDLREECENLLRRVDTKLSRNERTVLYLFLSGLSYREIADRLGITPKSVDNALQRVRHKLKGQ